MATKKKAQKPEFGAKAAFVRGAPKTLSAKEVVAAAAKKGLSVTENYVYTVRSGGLKTTKGKPGPKPGRGRVTTSATAAEQQLRAAIADLGLVTATRILESVRTTIKGG